MLYSELQTDNVIAQYFKTNLLSVRMDFLNVFVSRPNYLKDSFKKGLDNFNTRIEDLGLKGRTIGVTDQPTKAPLDEVLNLLDECRGSVVLGYPQIEFSNGSIKGVKIENQ